MCHSVRVKCTIPNTLRLPNNPKAHQIFLTICSTWQAHPSLQGMQWNGRLQTSWSFSTSFPQASPVLPRTMLPAQRCPSIVQWAQNHKQVLFINEHFLENGSLWHFDGVSSHWKLWQVRLYNNNNPTQEALLYLQPISTLSDKTQGHHHYRPRYCGYILLSLLSMSNVRRPRPSPNSHPLFTHSNGPLNFRVLCNHISWFSHSFSHIHLLDFDFHILLTISHNQSCQLLVYIGSSARPGQFWDILSSTARSSVRQAFSSLSIWTSSRKFRNCVLVPWIWMKSRTGRTGRYWNKLTRRPRVL